MFAPRRTAGPHLRPYGVAAVAATFGSLPPMTCTTLAVIGDIHAHWPRLDPVLTRIHETPDVAGVLLVGDIGAEPPATEPRT